MLSETGRDPWATNFAIAGNAGIGLETVKGLAIRGATVILGSRSVSKAARAVENLQYSSSMRAFALDLKSYSKPLLLLWTSCCIWTCVGPGAYSRHAYSRQNLAGGNLKLHVIELDLADLASVREFAAQVQVFLQGKKLDVLVILPTVPSLFLSMLLPCQI